MTLKGGTSQACAACKYQRRRCLPECQLAPYFPADQPKMFQNAHRLFGVSNILKILKEVVPSMRSEAMRSIIYESEIRCKSPVLGCYGYICDLECRVRAVEEQLKFVRSQIAMCKMQQCQNVVENDQFWGNQVLGVGKKSNNLVEYDQVKMQQHFSWSEYIGTKQTRSCSDGNMINNNNLVNQLEGMHTFLDGIDDRQSFVDLKAVQCYESNSSNSTGSMKAFESIDKKNTTAFRFSNTNII